MSSEVMRNLGFLNTDEGARIADQFLKQLTASKFYLPFGARRRSDYERRKFQLGELKNMNYEYCVLVKYKNISIIYFQDRC